jgi:hypothetical protein
MPMLTAARRAVLAVATVVCVEVDEGDTVIELKRHLPNVARPDSVELLVHDADELRVRLR